MSDEKLRDDDCSLQFDESIHSTRLIDHRFPLKPSSCVSGSFCSVRFQRFLMRHKTLFNRWREVATKLKKANK
jgi:hypothetical protein